MGFEYECECCGQIDNENGIKVCFLCTHQFCEPCIFNHPCTEGKSNPDRKSPFTPTVSKS